MGRPRIHDEPYYPLPKGLYAHRRRFRCRDEAGKWKSFDGPRQQAVDAYNAWRTAGLPGHGDSVAWMLDKFVEACNQRVEGKLLAPRTAKDYAYDSKALKAGLGKIPFAKLSPFNIAQYRDARAVTNPTHVRHEMACLSASLSWAVEQGLLERNPSFEVRRPSRKKRARLISDDEYSIVRARAEPSVQLAMLLAVRTLALPSDLLRIGADNVRKIGNKQVLSYRRSKTGALVEIEMDGELAEAVAIALEDPLVRFQKLPFVHTVPVKDPVTGNLTATPYTRDGLATMFRRCCVGGKGEGHGSYKALGEEEKVRDFGLRDLRAKGATDMYRAGIDVRQIQQLLGHSSETMTRTYLKGYITEIVKPNMVPIIGRVK